MNKSKASGHQVYPSSGLNKVIVCLYIGVVLCNRFNSIKYLIYPRYKERESTKEPIDRQFRLAVVENAKFEFKKVTRKEQKRHFNLFEPLDGFV